MRAVKFIMTTAGIIAGAASAAVSAASVNAAVRIAHPPRRTYESEIKWIKEHGMWGDFDLYDKQEYTVPGRAGYLLRCELIRSKETAAGNKYVILSHGYKANRYSSVKYVDCYIKLGYNCIIYDLRSHGMNADAVCTIGNHESDDLECLIRDTLERYGDIIQLGLHGESMGSSTSLSVLRYRPRVTFVVADCGFTNLHELLADAYKSYNAGFMIYPVNTMMKLLFRYDLHYTDAIGSLKGNTVPICFIHGSDDNFIIPENSMKMSRATDGYSEVHIVPGAAHAESREILGEEAYRKIIAGFLERI